MKPAYDWLRKLARTLAVLLIYGLVLGAAGFAAYELRFDFAVPVDVMRERLVLLPILVLVQLVALALTGQFGSLLTYFSTPDLLRIVAAMSGSGFVLFIVRFLGLTETNLPRGVLLIDFVLSLVVLVAVRLVLRIYRERFASPNAMTGVVARRIAILGAGDLGAALAGDALARPALGFRPVVFLDDDPRKHGRQIHGVPVMGKPDEIKHWREKLGIDECVVAMPSAPGSRLRELVRLGAAQGLKVSIVPSLRELATGKVQVSQIRQVELEDLLGRRAADLRSEQIKNLICGRTVMVTGAGGSIGSELCRQIASNDPFRLILVERCEVQMFRIEQELHASGYHAMLLPLVADILDEDRMRVIFERFKPNLIFHAAAHKHVPLMEHQPCEALKNNTQGTQLLANLASHYQVDRFILISTDKAINPTSAMGATKRLAELYLQALQQANGTATKFMAVRFGNVLGSSGSVIPTFKQQIANGGPVTVTHPEITRYFMTVQEAVGLVLQSTTQGRGGEIFVLDMGKPIKIADLAKQLIEFSGLQPGVDIAIEYIGLRPGEKLYEEISHDTENMVPTDHPSIMRFVGRPAALDQLKISLQKLGTQAPAWGGDQLKLEIQKLIPEYQPHLAEA